MSPIAFISLFLFGCAALPATESAPTKASSKTWVLLVAPTKAYEFYHTQANNCHAYQIVKKYGVPPEQVIVFLYDDVAHCKENPFPNNLINEPNGTNVYKGCAIDYKAENVTVKNFLYALTGNQTALDEATGGSGSKVIKSGPNDNIFVSITGSAYAHGSKIKFPGYDSLYPKQFNEALEKMHKGKKFNKMLVYIQGDQISPFFWRLKKEWGVYAVASTNRIEAEVKVFRDETRHAFLSDVFSYNWMHDSDQGLKGKTVNDQYQKVKKACSSTKKIPKTTVTAWGDLSVGNMSLASFQAGRKAALANGWL